MTKNTDSKEQPEDDCDTSMAERGRKVLDAILNLYCSPDGRSEDDIEEAVVDALADLQHALGDKVNVEEIGANARWHYLFEIGQG